MESGNILCQKGLNNQEIEREEIAPTAVHIEGNDKETRANKPAGSVTHIGKKTQAQKVRPQASWVGPGVRKPNN